MTAILNFKMADKLTYIQIRLYIMFGILGITNIMHNHHFNHSVMLRISFYMSIIYVCYIMTAILKFKMDRRQTNQYLT